MSRRDFRLGSVLRARKRELDVARGRLADQLREKEREQRERKQFLRRFHEASQQLHDRLAYGTSAAMLRTIGGAIEFAHSEAQLAGERAEARDGVIGEALNAITEARKRLRGLEILEEKWLQRRRRERAKNDQKRLDEIATQPRERILS